MKEIIVKNVKQCGDHFIFKFNCPFCGVENFNGDPQECSECDESYENMLINLEAYTFDLLAGTRRKAHFSKKLVKQMHSEQEGKCAYCMRVFLNKKYHVEHIKPLACGGGNQKDNLCLSCPRCNLLAGSRYFTDFYAKQKYLIERLLSEQKKKRGTP